MKQTLKTEIKDRQEMMIQNILSLINIGRDTLSQMIFDTAVTYMTSTGMGEYWMCLFLKEPLFWAWWRQQWSLVDEVFYYKYRRYSGMEKYQRQLREIYAHAHASIDIFPDEIIYDKIHDSYNQTSAQILKKHSKINR